MVRLCRFLVPAFAILVTMSAATAQAGFVLTLGNVVPSTVTFGSATSGTTVTLSPATSPQTFTGASNASVIEVAISSNNTGSTVNSGNFVFTQTLTLTGTGVNAGQNEVLSFQATFYLDQGYQGAILSRVVPTGFTVISGSGFNVSYYSYAAPSPGSSGGATSSNGNISLTISPSAVVPEPASIVMLGLGLVGTVGFAARRRTNVA